MEEAGVVATDMPFERGEQQRFVTATEKGRGTKRTTSEVLLVVVSCGWLCVCVLFVCVCVWMNESSKKKNVEEGRKERWFFVVCCRVEWVGGPSLATGSKQITECLCVDVCVGDEVMIRLSLCVCVSMRKDTHA